MLPETLTHSSSVPKSVPDSDPDDSDFVDSDAPVGSDLDQLPESDGNASECVDTDVQLAPRWFVRLDRMPGVFFAILSLWELNCLQVTPFLTMTYGRCGR